MKTRWRKNRPNNSGRADLLPDEHRARVIAARLGLFILFEGGPKNRTWRVYSRESGQVRGWWCPKSGLYGINGRSGKLDDAHEVLKLAAGVEVAGAA